MCDSKEEKVVLLSIRVETPEGTRLHTRKKQRTSIMLSIGSICRRKNTHERKKFASANCTVPPVKGLTSFFLKKFVAENA